MAELLKTAPEGQQPPETTSEVSSWKTFQLLRLFISILNSHLSSRAVASINTPLLHSNGRLLIIENQNPLFSWVLTNLREISTPLLLCFPSRRLQKRPRHRHPIRALGLSCPGCVGWFFESVIGRILGSGCRRRDGGWLLVRVVRLH
jgi:hypothetical protein